MPVIYEKYYTLKYDSTKYIFNIHIGLTQVATCTHLLDLV